MDCGKFHVSHYITLLLSTVKSQIKPLLLSGTVGTVLVNYTCHMYCVCWVTFLLFDQFHWVLIYICLSVAAWWLVVAGYNNYHHCLNGI